jgi:alcohol dehydrogenase class IV
VLSDPLSRRKVSVKGDGMFPRHAIVDADLLATLPASLVAWTGLDALTHALEALISRLANPISDALAETAIELILRFLPRAAGDIAGDEEARLQVMRASTTAGIAFGNADVGAVHCLSETLGGLFDLPHGLLNAILLLPVLRSHRPTIDPPLRRLDARLHGGVERGDGPDRVLEEVEQLVRALAVPPFTSLGIAVADFPAIAEGAVANGSNGSNPRPMGAPEYLQLLHSVIG